MDSNLPLLYNVESRHALFPTSVSPTAPFVKTAAVLLCVALALTTIKSMSGPSITAFHTRAPTAVRTVFAPIGSFQNNGLLTAPTASIHTARSSVKPPQSTPEIQFWPLGSHATLLLANASLGLTLLFTAAYRLGLQTPVNILSLSLDCIGATKSTIQEATKEPLVIACFAMSGASDAGISGVPMLEVKDLHACVVGTGQQILKGFNLTINEGEVHAIMGKNGSGKSTFTKVLVGHPGYEVTSGSVTFRGKDLLSMDPEERSHAGMFLSFQAPIEIPGVSNTDFLRLAYNAKQKARGLPEKDPLEFYGYLMPKVQQLKMDPSFLTRNVNEGFSGGEKKRNEILQLAILEADLALLDEIDSGLDVDALRDVAAAVNGLKRPDSALLMITHYKRLLDLIEPDFIHIVADGKVIQSGDKSLSGILEEEGFMAFK